MSGDTACAIASGSGESLGASAPARDTRPRASPPTPVAQKNTPIASTTSVAIAARQSDRRRRAADCALLRLRSRRLRSRDKTRSRTGSRRTTPPSRAAVASAVTCSHRERGARSPCRRRRSSATAMTVTSSSNDGRLLHAPHVERREHARTRRSASTTGEHVPGRSLVTRCARSASADGRAALDANAIDLASRAKPRAGSRSTRSAHARAARPGAAQASSATEPDARRVHAPPDRNAPRSLP